MTTSESERIARADIEEERKTVAPPRPKPHPEEREREPHREVDPHRAEEQLRDPAPAVAAPTKWRVVIESARGSAHDLRWEAWWPLRIPVSIPRFNPGSPSKPLDKCGRPLNIRIALLSPLMQRVRKGHQDGCSEQERRVSGEPCEDEGRGAPRIGSGSRSGNKEKCSCQNRRRQRCRVRRGGYPDLSLPTWDPRNQYQRVSSHPQ